MDDNNFNIHITDTGAGGTCEECGEQAAQLYSVTLEKAGKMSVSLLCGDCVAKAARRCVEGKEQETAAREAEEQQLFDIPIQQLFTAPDQQPAAEAAEQPAAEAAEQPAVEAAEQPAAEAAEQPAAEAAEQPFINVLSPTPKKREKKTLPLFLLIIFAVVLGLALAIAFDVIHLPGSKSASVTEAQTQTTAAATDATEAPTTEPETDADVDDSLIHRLSSVLIVDDAAYEYYNFTQSTADRYAKAISHAATSLKGRARVFDLVVPTSMDITLSDQVRKRITNTDDQKEAIETLYAAIASDCVKVNTFDTLRAHRKEYIYFRTDHHWTALGAYYAYREYAAAAGLTPAELSDFTERKFENFVGAFYLDSGKNKALEKNPDTIYAYEPKATNAMTFTDRNGKEVKWSIITDVSKWSRSSRYNTFIGGDNPYAYICYPKETEWSSCVVVKESFGNAFVPFLLANYNEIHVIDYRYWKGDLTSFVLSTGAKDVIFVNNISATRNAVLIKSLESIT